MTSTSLLIVLDGWGHSDAVNDNAIRAANTPAWDALMANAPHSLISGSGSDVGLPAGQMGNSEVGHMNLGAGRVVAQDLTLIDNSIADGSFRENAPLQSAIASVGSGQRLHLIGLLSPGGVHSHESHFSALIDIASEKLADRGVDIVVHAFLDGRDTPPRSAAASLALIEGDLVGRGVGRIASICGRYFAMDRDNRWDRVEAAYSMLTEATATYAADDPIAGLDLAYARGEGDEFVQPTIIGEPMPITDGDAVIFMNFRADRARELSRALVQSSFDEFTRAKRPQLSNFITFTQYADDLGTQAGDQATSCAFPPEFVGNSLGEHLANLDKTQLRIAETEKYAHVTFFFSGGREEPFEGETRILVPSPRVSTYDLAPEMSAREVTDRLIDAITHARFDTIICNFANGDMVGHTGNFHAAVQAVETLDECLGEIVEACRQAGAHCLITADHGNVERMKDPDTGQPHTAHTSELVPLVYVGPRTIEFARGGTLADVAPTLLELMQLPIPAEMTGRSLILDGSEGNSTGSEGAREAS